MTVEEATTTADLDRLRPEWEALWAADPSATPFQHPAWLIPWWRHVAEGDLWTLAVARRRPARRPGAAVRLHAADRVARRVPARRRHERLPRRAVLPGHDRCGGGRLRAPGRTAVDRWDVLDLRPLRPDSPLRPSPRRRGWADQAADGDCCPCCRCRPRVGREPGAEPPVLPPPGRAGGGDDRAGRRGNAAELYDALRRLHAARWATRGEPGRAGRRRRPAGPRRVAAAAAGRRLAADVRPPRARARSSPSCTGSPTAAGSTTTWAGSTRRTTG